MLKPRASTADCVRAINSIQDQLGKLDLLCKRIELQENNLLEINSIVNQLIQMEGAEVITPDSGLDS